VQINLVRSVILHTSCQAKVQPLTIVICGVDKAFLGGGFRQHQAWCQPGEGSGQSAAPAIKDP